MTIVMTMVVDSDSIYRQSPMEKLFGIDRGRFEMIGNVGDPIEVEWEAESRSGGWEAIGNPDRLLKPGASPNG